MDAPARVRRRGACAAGRPRGESGMVTAEFAVALPALVLVIAMAVLCLGLSVDEIRCIDAARAGARAAARGDSAPAVVEVARRAAPRDAAIDVATSGAVTVTVTAPPRPGPLGAFPRPRATSTMPSEALPAPGGSS